MLHTVSLKENHVFRRLYHRGATAGNRLLGRLREVYRLHEAELLPGYDIVIVARSRAMEADFAELTRAFLTLAGRTGLMQEAAQ